MNWILFGFRGCGKTTLARLASEKFSLPFFGTDEWIESVVGLSPKEIVEEHGPGAFRTLETVAVQKAAGLKGHLIATGGATLLHSGHYELLKPTAHFIYLKPSQAILKKRWDERPLVNEADFETVYRARLPLYEKMAESVIMPETAAALENLWEVIHSGASFRSQHGESPTAKPLV